MGEDLAARLARLEQRLFATEDSLASIREDLIREVAARRRAEASLAPALDQKEEALRALRFARNPSIAWNRMRADLAVDLPGAESRIEGMPRLAYYPTGVFNPYLELIYSRCAESGWLTGPLSTFTGLDLLESGDIFHLHWTKFVMAASETEEEASDAVDGVLARIDAAIGRGVRFLWSVHEATPHETPYLQQELRLRRSLVDRAEIVHVLHRSTVNEVSDSFPLPGDKVAVVEHPLYTGFYSNYTTRTAARSMLGFGGETVILAFGAIRPYKGHDRLFRTSVRLQEEGVDGFRIVVAGPVYPNVDSQDILMAGSVDSKVSIVGRPVPSEQVHILFNAADVVAVPYHNFHNSGVAMLGLTFGKRILIAENPVSADLAGSPLVTTFEGGSDQELYQALRKLIESPNDPIPLDEQTSKRYDPYKIAGEFADLIGRAR